MSRNNHVIDPAVKQNLKFSAYKTHQSNLEPHKQKDKASNGGSINQMIGNNSFGQIM